MPGYPFLMPPSRTKPSAPAARSAIVQAGAAQFKQCSQWFNLREEIGSMIPSTPPCHYRIAKTSWPSHNRDTISWSLPASGCGEFFRTFNVA
jgi:hypothetical protein